MNIELEKAFKELEQMSFPKHPESDELSDWILELAELDGYIAGITSNAV